MPARSSLAARRGTVSPIGQPAGGASCGNRSLAGGVGAAVAASLLAAGSKDVPVGVSGARILRASWMAVSASSVASFDFWGIFAISVVASHYAGLFAAARTVAIKRDHAARTA